MNFKLLHAGRYTLAQTDSQTTEKVFLVLNLSGLEWGNCYFPSGERVCRNANASLALIPPGFTLDFCYNDQRENFVLVCDIPELTWSESNRCAELEHVGTRLKLPFYIPLSPARSFRLGEKFSRIIAMQNKSLPSALFAAEQQSASLLGEYATEELHHELSPTDGLAEKIRACIDNDVHFHDSLTVICGKIGVSNVHARRCFKHKYNIPPSAYRSKLKVNRIMELLSQSSLSPKEIAGEVGMKNVTHLHSFLKNECGQSPGSLRKSIWKNRL